MNKAIACGLLVASVLLSAGCCFPGSSKTNSATPADPDAGARGAGHEFAKRIIKPLLKSPTTAEFPWDSVSFERMAKLTDRHGDTAERWRVSGAVDAKNAFGVPIRHEWSVVVMRMTGSSDFAAAAATLDGKLVFSLDGYAGMTAENKVNTQKAESQRTAREDPAAAARLRAEEAARRQRAADAAAQAEKDRQDAAAKAKRASDEREAEGLMVLARELDKAGKLDKAIERLRKIVETYPDTKAAGEAKELLKRLDK